MKISRQSILDVVAPILEVGAVKAVRFLDEKTRMKATRKVWKRGYRKNRRTDVEILLTIGQPNYAERKLIKNAIKKDRGFLKSHSLVIFPKEKP